MRSGAKQQLAQHLRRNMTDAERRLWRQLRDRQVLGCKFRRQHPVGPYVADFASIDAMLVLEVDGSQHADSIDDAARTRFIEATGYLVLRFWNNDVLGNIEGVIAMIQASLLESCPHPNLPPQAGEGAKQRGFMACLLPPQAGEGAKQRGLRACLLPPQAGEGWDGG